MTKTWAQLVADTIDQIGEAVEDGDELDKVIANAIFEITSKEMNVKSLARIATALEKLAGLSYEIEVNNE